MKTLNESCSVLLSLQEATPDTALNTAIAEVLNAISVYHNALGEAVGDYLEISGEQETTGLSNEETIARYILESEAEMKLIMAAIADFESYGDLPPLEAYTDELE